MGSTRTGPRRERIEWIDAARGVALFSMFVAHTGPSGGPAGVLNLTEHLTAALFAALIGVSARLEAGRTGLGPALLRSLWRGAVLVALTLLNAQFGAGVVDILGFLAVVTLLAALLAGLPWMVRAGLAALLMAVAPLLQSTWGAGRLALSLTQSGLDPALASGIQDLAAGPYYRLPSLLLWALVGSLVLDSLTRGRGGKASRPRALVVCAAGTVVAVVVMVWIRWERGSFLVPYTGEQAEVVFNTALVVAVVAGCAAVVPLLPLGLTRLLAVPGSMTLTLYVAHTAFLGWVARHPGPWQVSGGYDDSWLVLGTLMLGAVMVALLWRTGVRRAPWSAGPIEGVIRAAENLVGGSRRPSSGQ